MPEFNDLQQALHQSRQQRQATGLALFQARERLKRIREEQARLQRYFDPENEAQQARAQRLQRRQRQTEAEIEQLQSSLTGIREQELGRLEEFQVFTDPRENVGRMDDSYPFFLFPLRLETRFKRLETEEGPEQQLWVRIFPDDALIDTFEETLSEAEVENAQKYWINHWRAGGVEEEARGAWRSLVSSHGSGRAFYIINQYQPANAEEPPEKEAGELILVVKTETELPETERSAIAAYWTAYWKAGSDREAREAAFAELVDALGEERANEVAENLQPAKLSDEAPAGMDRADVTVTVAFIRFPSPEEVDTKQQSWSRAPEVHLLPDRFVLLGYRNGEEVLNRVSNPVPSPLVVGPDPLAGEDGQFNIVDGDLQVSEELKWMVDFDEAVRIGMGFRINLSAEQFRAGFDRLFVLGLRLSTDADAGKEQLETLFDHHQSSKKGFSLLPQGVPTNNTEQVKSGLSRLDDPDISYDNYFKKGDLYTETDDPFEKLDGQWLAEYLGLDTGIFKKTYQADGRDQCEARAMNTALWPATLGYLMDSMMQPVFSEADIEQTRNFFRHFVSGRGPAPAIRIGRQPYGILPTAAYSRLSWMERDTAPPTHGGPWPGGAPFISDLYGILRKVGDDWSVFQEEISYIGKPGDAHQILLDVVGLHAGSVEFYQRYAESFQQLYNRLNLQGLGGAFLALLIAGAYVESGLQLLRDFGYEHSEKEGAPEILEKFFLQKANLLKRAVIDDRPLSETEPIRKYTTNEKNYIGWLIEAATTSHDALRKQEGFLGGDVPNALLYLMLRYALDQGYYETSLQLHRRAELLSGVEARRLKREPNFMYVEDDSDLSGESKWAYLYRTESRITDNPDLLIGDYIAQIYEEDSAAQQFREQIEALRHLENTPTARLERAFAEHIDLCTYRLDAWKQGLLNYQLSEMRNLGREEVRTGIYLGAYGWLEDVRPENKRLSPVKLPSDLRAIFQREGESPLQIDESNAGYIHAPSLNQAVTAAVLRNGYLSNAAPENPETLSINLSSERVRLALSFIEGMRNGQSLGALLGYRLERGLHDRYELLLDQYIYDLRKAFPLYADRLNPTRTDPEVGIKQIEARNVVNGLDLVDHVLETGQRNYPFGKDSLPTDDITDEQRAAIDQEVQNLLNIHDAIADLALAESVHQVVQNNYERAGATLDAFSKGDFPPIPDVIQTPRSGFTLTHRVGIQLQAGLTPAAFPDSSPRAKTEPAVNQWLSTLLPDPGSVVCTAYYYDHGADAEVDEPISQADLQLQPLDLIYLLRTGDEQRMTVLDDYVVHHLRNNFTIRPDAAVRIEYATREEGQVSFFELAALLRSLRPLVLESRPLSPGDVILPGEVSKAEDQYQTLDRERVAVARGLLQDLLDTELDPLLSALTPLVDVEDINTNRDAIINALDSWIGDFADLSVHSGRFGLIQAGVSSIYARRRTLYRAMLDKVEERVNRWNKKLSDYDSLISDYESMPPDTGDSERFAVLQRAELILSTSSTQPLPGSPSDFKSNTLDPLRADFVAKRDSLAALLDTNAATLKALRDAILAELPLSDYDLEAFSLADQERQMLVLSEDLLQQLKNLKSEVEGRLAKSQEQLDTHDTSADPVDRVEALRQGGKAIFGEDFVMVPEFELAEERADEWEKAWNDRDQLLAYQRDQQGNRFPVDEWLYGLGRVREKIQHWENATMLLEGFDESGTTEIDLAPIQLPYREEDRWLALQFKDPEEDFEVGSHRLLYTAHYAQPFDKGAPQCGLLVDEWTEVIPTKQETTGLTFHYDRPNSEPPQTMLLVMPTDFRGSWQWADIVDALHETLDRAKERALEPQHVEKGAYARFLPATISAVTVYPITVALNYAFNNQVYTQLNTD